MNVTDRERSGYLSLSNTFSHHIDEMVWADGQVLLEQSQLALISHTAMRLHEHFSYHDE